MLCAPSSDHRPDRAPAFLAVLLILGLAQATSPAAAQTVRSKPSADQVSDLLRPPGEDPYGAATDWQAIPSWQQASFYGVRARGQLFVYVVDCSGSMADDGRLVRAKAELRRSIQALRWPQRFLVIFYNDQMMPLAGGLPQSANASTKAHAMSWMRRIDADGATDPRQAMKLALGTQPDAVFLLSDGEFPEGTASTIARGNPGRVPVHAIDLMGGGAGDQLRRIAAESGGTYAARP